MFEQKLKILKSSLGTHYCSNDELIFKCPKCNHHKRKLSVNIQKNVFKCWVCDYRGNDLFPLVKGRDLKHEWKLITNTIDISRFDDLFAESEQDCEIQALELPEYFVSLSDSNLSSQGTQAKKYLLGRGFTEEQILLYKIGFCFHGRYKNRVIIPSFDFNGKVNYFIARAFDENRFKYMNPQASKDIIFNDIFIDWKKPIVLVEGFFDSVKYENSIPILGSTLSRSSVLFNKIIENSKKVYICLDNDAIKKELKIIKNLLDFGVEVAKINLDQHSDLGDVPNDALAGLKKRAAIITQQDYLLYRISGGGISI